MTRENVFTHDTRIVNSFLLNLVKSVLSSTIPNMSMLESNLKNGDF